MTQDSLKGERTIMVFTFAKCIFACPMITFQLQDLDRELDHPDDLRYLHISVNPDLDTPEEILMHFQKHDIDPVTDPRWLFLSGPASRTPSVLEAYGIGVKRTPIEGDVLTQHTTKVLVINTEGNVVKTFGTYLWDTEEMRRALYPTDG